MQQGAWTTQYDGRKSIGIGGGHGTGCDTAGDLCPGLHRRADPEAAATRAAELRRAGAELRARHGRRGCGGLMRIAMALEGPRITVATLRTRPMGGTEAAFAVLAEAFARRGHEVEALTGEEPAETREGIAWCPIGAGSGAPADLVIAARVPRLFAALPPPRGRGPRRLLWLFNPCSYLRKPQHLWPLLKARPVAVTLGRYHDGTLPRWMPVAGRAQLPLPVAAPFDRPPAQLPQTPPPPVAIFASNPERGLDWLLELWERRIAPAVPGAELHCYTGAATYGGDPRLAARTAPVLARAAALAAAG